MISVVEQSKVFMNDIKDFIVDIVPDTYHFTQTIGLMDSEHQQLSIFPSTSGYSYSLDLNLVSFLVYYLNECQEESS